MSQEKAMKLLILYQEKKYFADPSYYPDITQCFMIQMLGRGRGRLPQRGIGRVSQDFDYAQYQRFLE